MSEQTEMTMESSQSSQTTGQTSELNRLSQGQEDSILSNAASVTTHQADSLTTNPPKQNESGKDTPVIKTEQQASEEEEYDLELSKDSLLTEEDLNEIAEEAGRLNLSKKDAEKLLSMRESAYKKGMTKVEAEYKEKVQKSLSEIKNHPDFIGDKKVKSFESINRVVTAFGDDNLINALKSPEIGNNLALALFLKRLGDAMAPDSVEGKGATAPVVDSKESTLQALYPDFFKGK